MNTIKHFLLSLFTTITALASFPKLVYARGLMPDATTPFGMIVEKDIADKVGLKADKKAEQINIAAILETTNDHDTVAGIIFKGDIDIKTLISSDMMAELSGADSDTLAYIGTKLALNGDDDIDDKQIQILAIGPQAETIIGKFAELGAHGRIDDSDIKLFFDDLKAATTKQSFAKRDADMGAGAPELVG